MATIDDVRRLFIEDDGFDGKVKRFLSEYLHQIDMKKRGTMVGRYRGVDYRKVAREARFNKSMVAEEEVIKRIVALYEGVPLWEHPLVQTNVIPPPTAISVATAALTARYNENSVWDRFGVSAAHAEALAVGMLAELVGYDRSIAGGVFTFGGTGCNLYAARLGIEKASPGALLNGLTRPVSFFASDVSHYSVKTAAIWTGVGMKNTVSVATGDDNAMKVEALEEALERAIEKGHAIGTIFATMGTTDAFGVDPIEEIAAVRDRFQKRVGHAIHLHADAVIGWSYLTLEEGGGMEGFSDALRHDLGGVIRTIRGVRYADSIGIDFHKTGWAPYLCSVILMKDEKEFSLLNRNRDEMPYLYQGDGYQPGVFTLESSRPNYAQKAVANILAMGRDGYSALILHLLGVADQFRAMVQQSPDITLLNRHNPAFVTDMRVYPMGFFLEAS